MIENRDVQKDLEQVDFILKEQGISRRDAMKIVGLSGATLIGSSQVQASTEIEAKGKILIIGGGLAGMSTAAKLSNTIQNPDITIIEPQTYSVSYQPGQTLIGAGFWKKSDVMYQRDDFVPNASKIIKEKAIEFDPDNNTVTTHKGTIVHYDFLIISTGVKLNYSPIKGLEEVGELYSLGKNDDAIKALNNKGVSSIYTMDGAEQTWKNMESYISKVQNGDKKTAIFTQPNTPIKCEGTPKQIMYLTNIKLNEVGTTARSNANLDFYSSNKKMSEIKDYHTAIEEQFEQRKMNYFYNHNLTEIKNGIAVFDTEEQKENTSSHQIEKEFDFIHVTPPMKAPDEIAKSKLGSDEGWVPVNKETLQHISYPNVFALGDIANVPMGKTASSVKKQHKVVVNNLISLMTKGEIPSSNLKYDGYTGYPLMTDIGTVMLTEFNWDSKEKGSGKNAAFTSLLDPTKERYIWWLLKMYFLKPMTVYGMLAGRA